MLSNIRLQLFAEGAGEATGGQQNAADTDFAGKFESQFGYRPGTAAPEKGEQKAEPKKAEQGQAPAAEQNTQEQQPEDADAEFETLIKGKFKDAYGKRVQNAVNDRFKNHSKALSEAQQQLAEWKDAVGPYLAKLGVDPNDLEAVRAAALDDQSNFRSRALAENITIEEAIQRYQDDRAAQKQQAEQQRLADEAQQRAEMEQQQAVFDAWKAEADAIRQDDPEFDLRAEINNNPAFAKLLDNGASVTEAYRATHYEANMAKVAGAVERQTAINTAQMLAGRKSRPAEGGLAGGAAASSKVDYKNLPTKDIMAIFEESLKH